MLYFLSLFVIFRNAFMYGWSIVFIASVFVFKNVFMYGWSIVCPIVFIASFQNVFTYGWSIVFIASGFHVLKCIHVWMVNNRIHSRDWFSPS